MEIVNPKRLLIQIPEKLITEKFGWLAGKGNTREGVVRTYILKHPEIIRKDLTIENLVAINVWLNNWEKGGYNREADLMFEKDGIYYIVETKREGKYGRGWGQLGDLIDCFKSEFKRHQDNYRELIPVLVTTSDAVNEIQADLIQE